MTDSEHQERKIAETAYCFRVLGFYGTLSKAVTAMRNRKGMEHIDRRFANDALNRELALLDRTHTLIQDVLNRAKRSCHTQLTKQQFDSGTEFIHESLTRDFPDLSQSINYMMAMLWYMPRLR